MKLPPPTAKSREARGKIIAGGECNATARQPAPRCAKSYHGHRRRGPPNMQHLDASGGGMFAPVKRAAERLVRAHRDAIKRVAVALIERGDLIGAEVHSVLG